MKKIILVLFTTISIFSVKAQIKFGIKAGLNIANLKTAGLAFGTSTSSKADFNGGVMAEMPFSPKLYLQPELLYSGQGLSFSDPVSTGKASYGYLNLPVLLKYQHTSGFFAETGPQFGLLLSAKIKGSGYSVDTKSHTQSTDFSWAFGLGYKLQNIPAGIDIRYNLGLTNMDKDDDNGIAKNSVFQIDIFYFFGGK